MHRSSVRVRRGLPPNAVGLLPQQTGLLPGGALRTHKEKTAMAVLVTVDIAGLSQQQFESIARDVGTSTQLAAGNLFRAALPIVGGWRVISAWESFELFQTYMRERLRPAYERAGIEPTRLEVATLAEVRIAS